jgi:hypothetical protein
LDASNGNRIQSIYSPTLLFTLYPKSIILDASNNVIAACSREDAYFVFKVAMDPSVSATTYAIKESSSVGESGAYALISDGNNGYYVSGYI